MRRKRTHTLWIFIGTIIFFLLIVYTAVKIYNIALDETKRNHQLLQRDMADAAAAGINYYLENLANDLRLVAAFHRLQHFERDLLRDPIDDLFKHAALYGVQTIFVTDLDANLVYSPTDTIPKWVNPILKKQIQWANKVENRGKSWYSKVWPEDIDESQNELYFVILVPLVKNSKDSVRPHSGMEPVGLVGEVVSFDWLVQKYVASINLGATGSAWIMDGLGRLLFHPKHPEMVLRDVLEMSSDCLPCHSSFNIQKHIIATDAAYGEYTVGEEPTKIMSHVPIDIQDERLVLVITTYLSEVTAILRGKFHLFFILVAIILIAIVISGLLFYYIDIKRIRAEEARRHSEQREHLHQQICHAAKMASIGELVDTVAHEINTPTSIIATQADAFLLNQMGADTRAEEVCIIKEQTRRISNYTRSLLNYSQRMPFQQEPTDLSKLFGECLYLLGHRFRAHKIIITTNFADNLLRPLVDYRQIEQVFINLLNNAIDAIDGPGEIKINICQKREKSEKGIEITISDNGKGISEESLPHIFKPFYTTKPPSKGTGLGLSISKAIIQRHQGKISVSSTIDQGTTFCIFLPLNTKEG